MKEIKVLIMDVLSLLKIFNNKNSEIFFILFIFMKKSDKIVTNFTNKSLCHSLIIIGNVLYNSINFINITCNIFNANLLTYIIQK